MDKGHGRVERRTLTATPLLNAYLRQQGWPDVGQVFRLERSRTVRGKTSVEVAYGITSLSPRQASPERLLALVRSHWRIENSLHWMRDVTLGEDACQARCGSTPQVLAALRNLVLRLLKRIEAPSRAAALRRLASLPHLALQALNPTQD